MAARKFDSDSGMYDQQAAKEVDHLSDAQIAEIAHSELSVNNTAKSTGLTATQVLKCIKLVESDPDRFPYTPLTTNHRELTVEEWISELQAAWEARGDDKTAV